MKNEPVDFSLLKTLCSIHAPSGNEAGMTNFLLRHIEKVKSSWKNVPTIYSGDGFQNCIVLVFGNPRTAVFAHIDNIGYTVRYHRGLVKIGGPHANPGAKLYSTDNGNAYECVLKKDDEENFSYASPEEFPRGTSLSYVPDWREDGEYVQCCYMDNRLGVWNALKICETLEDGAIVFSCWEEHGGGSISFLLKFLYEKYSIRQALISDITWVTEGVQPGKGVVVSMRDSGIPRKVYVDKIIELAKKSNIPFQLEVEGYGGSDGTEIQKQPYPVDWCFVGAPEDHVHTPDEKVHKKDIQGMVGLYEYLMKHL
jgi:putative aminopeptidase FrvX